MDAGIRAGRRLSAGSAQTKKGGRQGIHAVEYIYMFNISVFK